MSNKNNRMCKSSEFERKYGPNIFLKMWLSSISQFLIEKGIATKEELWELFKKQT